MNLATLMRWLPFAILACLTVVCQTAVVPLVAIGSIRPDWMFILAVHYALWGRWPEAAIAAWLLGLIVDLHTAPPTPVGLHAMSYGAAAWMIMRVRQVLFRDHPVTHVVVTLVCALAVRLIIAVVHGWRAPESIPWGGLWWPAFFTAVYTAAWAPYLHWPLIRLGRWTGLQPSRRGSVWR